jgi:glycosyltransferase involved in cell wall biosynthesis
MKPQPLVSIIIPTYNRAHLIGETLDSVLAQTYSNWECIIVDDGSTDNTAEVVGEYLKKDSRFQYHHRPADRPKGANACRNYGFELSEGEYIQWLDSDDLLANSKLQSQVQLFYKDLNSKIVFGRWEKFESKISHSFDINQDQFYKSYANGLEFLEAMGKYKTFMASHAYLLKRDLLENTGLWNPHLSSNQDGEFFSRVLLLCNNIEYCKNSLVYYRISSNETVSSFSSEQKIHDVINTWKLIETRMKLAFGDLQFQFIEHAKNRVFIDLNKSNFSTLKFTYRSYFTTQLIAEKKYLKSKSLKARIWKKVKRIIQKG